MAASYPSALKTYTDKVNGTSIVDATDINSVQAEVQAVENYLGVNPHTTALPSSTGTYAPSGTTSTVADRIKNLEAGVSSLISSDVTHVGYTQLATGSVSSSTVITVSGSSYIKLVLVVNITTKGSASTLTLTANTSTASAFGYFTFAATPAGVGNASGSGGMPISNNVAPVGDGDTITVEIYNCAGAGAKPVTFINGTGWGSGKFTTGATAAITTLTLTCTTAPTASTYTVYGVK